MNDPFALDLTIILLLLGVGAAMLAGNVLALFKSNKKSSEIYTTRTIFLAIVGLVISIWSIASLINR
tara:strand:- start:1221 stop:1421 length:201 start_codon:yes stop_codon:yes gene_type:complete